MYLSKKKKIYNINNFKNKITNKITNKIYNNLAKTLKKYKKNKKLKNNKKRKSKKILKKNMRFAKGKIHEILFLINIMLDRTSKSSFNKEFYNEDIIKEIIGNKTIQDEIKKVRVEKLKKDIKINEKLLIEKEDELNKRNAHGEDGPSRRTRSRGRYNKDKKIQDLENKINELYISISDMKYKLNNLTNPSAYLRNY
jgi:hypothetical protein